MINYNKIKYFTAKEMASPDDPNTGYMMDLDFMLMLDKAREIAGVSFKITSGFRSYEHNNKAGFTRIGLDSKRNFIHVDLDDSKALDVLWGY